MCVYKYIMQLLNLISQLVILCDCSRCITMGTSTLCDANYAMKERSDVKVTNTLFEDLFLNFIWHKLGLNTLSRYRDRATDTSPKIMGDTPSDSYVAAVGHDYTPTKLQRLLADCINHHTPLKNIKVGRERERLLS